jgi:hypothetical protein
MRRRIMRWLRFSIASVMALIFYAAIGFAAFANAGDPWYGRVLNDVFYLITIGALAIATLLAVLRRGRSRAAWLGFAVFGWVHLIFGWPDSGLAPTGGTWRPRFPHTEILSYAIQDILFPGSHREEGAFKWHIIQSVVTIATALVGAVVGTFLCVRGERLEGGFREASIGGRDRPSGSSP